MPFTLINRYVAWVLTIRGHFLGHRERMRIQQAFALLTAAGPGRLVIDLSGAEFVDSSGLGLLVEGARRVQALGGEVSLAGTPRRLRHLFAITRLISGLFEEFETVEEALQKIVLLTQADVCAQASVHVEVPSHARDGITLEADL